MRLCSSLQTVSCSLHAELFSFLVDGNLECGKSFNDLDTMTSPVTGSTSDESNEHTLSCGYDQGNEAIFRVTVPVGATLTIRQSENNYDSRHELSYGQSCSTGISVICRDDPVTLILSTKIGLFL